MWCGRALSDEEVERLTEAIAHSSIPDAIGTIVDSWDVCPECKQSFLDGGRGSDGLCDFCTADQ